MIYHTITFVLIRIIEVECFTHSVLFTLKVNYDLSVVLGVLVKGDMVLISQRKRRDKLGGEWELPGGKKEPGETNFDVLRRELKEEVGISVISARPLIAVTRNSEEGPLSLTVFEVVNWSGSPEGKEGQEIRWVSKDEIFGYSFPIYNAAINIAITLPTLACVTPPLLNSVDKYIESILSIAKSGVKLIQLRPQISDNSKIQQIALKMAERLRSMGVILMLNGKVSHFNSSLFQGLHLSQLEASKCTDRPISETYLLSTSCHDVSELDHALRIGVDFVYLSPIKSTRSHPGRMPLGWNRLHEMVERSSVPVFALGGLSYLDVVSARQIGCQGIAVQSSLWRCKDRKKYLREIDRSLQYLDHI